MSANIETWEKKRTLGAELGNCNILLWRLSVCVKFGEWCSSVTGRLAGRCFVCRKLTLWVLCLLQPLWQNGTRYSEVQRAIISLLVAEVWTELSDRECSNVLPPLNIPLRYAPSLGSGGVESYCGGTIKTLIWKGPKTLLLIRSIHFTLWILHIQWIACGSVSKNVPVKFIFNDYIHLHLHIHYVWGHHSRIVWKSMHPN